MIVEGLGSVTFVNGILRVETLMVKSDGTVIIWFNRNSWKYDW